MKNRRRLFGAAAVLAGAVLLALLLWGNQEERPRALTYGEFWQLAQSGQVRAVTLGRDPWQVTLADGAQAETPDPGAADGKERLLALGIETKESQSARPELLLCGALLLFVLALSYRRGAGAVGLQKYAAVSADQKIPEVTFDDVAVAEDTLRSMRDLAAFLKEPEKFRRLGARRPRGVMLYGPPGTGKTLLARALAGETKTPFFAMSGADFVQVYVGVGASRVRELFRKARKAGGGVIFIDEIDAIGKRRDSGNDEREQTLNALLTEMSGFSSGRADGIIVLAATNRIDTLDGALLREGRFDRRIEVGLPDLGERLKILQVHARGKPLRQDVRLEDLARRTTLFSGAQLETLLNEAAIRAGRRNAEQICPEDVEASFCAVTVGDQRPGRLTDEEKKIIAWHEAGHALATRCLQPEAQLTRVTIIPSARGAAGYSMSIQPDRQLHTKKELSAMISVALAGRAAEEMLLGADNVTTGAANDWQKAREIAAAMTDQFGLGETGDGVKDRETILARAMENARQCLMQNQDTLKALAGLLLEKETLTEKELFDALDAGKEKTAPSAMTPKSAQ